MNIMNKINTILLLILIITNHSHAGTVLNGDYTIGGNSPDYPSITSAVSDLNSNGISGPVNFYIRVGSYDEAVTITDFTRLGSATDRVTFTKSGIAGIVDWRFNSMNATTDWILKFDGASYITIADIEFTSTSPSFGDIISLDDGANYITIERSVFNGQLGIGDLISKVQFIPDIHDNHFYFNTFSRGHKAIKILNSSFKGIGIEINDNTFTDQANKAVELRSEESLIKRNMISAGTISNPDYIGLFINDNTATIESNTIDMSKGRSGILVEGFGNLFRQSIIFNNIVALHSSNASGAGIEVESSFVNIDHNTVRSVSPNAPALYIRGSAHDVRIHNNILINDATKAALRIDDPDSMTASDFNNIFSTGNPVVKWNGNDYVTVSSYSTASGLDVNTTEKPVSFVDITGPNNLHLASPSNNDVNLLAPKIANITTDIDDNIRSRFKVFKGADEGIAISPLANEDVVAGFYTVGGSTPDYISVNAAIFNLKQRGMMGDVTFSIRAGSYTTHQTIEGGLRSDSPDDLIKFVAADFNNPPIIRWNATNSDNNWVMRIRDTSYIEFDHINFLTTSTNIYGHMLVIEGDSDYITMKNNIITGVTGQTAKESTLISATGFGLDNYNFSNNQFNNGSIALDLLPTSAFTQPIGTGLVIESNSFNQQSVNTLATNHDNIDIIGNEISSNIDDFKSIHIKLNKDSQINKNKFILTGTNSTAISLEGADGSSVANPSVISNNFIKAPVGIDINSGSNNTNIYYNSIVATSLPVNIQTYVNGSYNIKLTNNILLNNGTGPAIFVAENAEIIESNFNNFLNTSGNLIDWQASQYNTVEDFQLATSFDARSTSTPVFFANLSNADFHLTASSIANTSLTGTPLALVTDDYDYDARTAASPYMGADQVLGNPIINTYSIGGSIAGLVNGNTIDIENITGDTLLNRGNGDFTFSFQQNDGDFYQVSVLANPTNPNQICIITNGFGLLAGENMENVLINCGVSDIIFMDGFETTLTRMALS